ncbi:MAG: hypothetical protein ACK53V_00835, partial [Planctomycetota bacterium]
IRPCLSVAGIRREQRPSRDLAAQCRRSLPPLSEVANPPGNNRQPASLSPRANDPRRTQQLRLFGQQPCLLALSLQTFVV